MPAPMVAQHFNLARRRVEKTLNDFNRRRFAGAVRTEQAKALADFHAQIQSADRLHRRLGVVSLYKLVTTNRKHCYFAAACPARSLDVAVQHRYDESGKCSVTCRCLRLKPDT